MEFLQVDNYADQAEFFLSNHASWRTFSPITDHVKISKWSPILSS